MLSTTHLDPIHSSSPTPHALHLPLKSRFLSSSLLSMYSAESSWCCPYALGCGLTPCPSFTNYSLPKLFHRAPSLGLCLLIVVSPPLLPRSLGLREGLCCWCTIVPCCLPRWPVVNLRKNLSTLWKKLLQWGLRTALIYECKDKHLEDRRILYQFIKVVI